ncbi:hypothetical protein [Pseudomonas sp. Xaverov 259]|uniref:hypothetical protein n=1 Tax=Pseudomonas sp. Xaverov 259 TaxID=2666086 RepID=UPI001C5AAFA5|nr:hypothetical protein [Pseudomonas sp. Xaverov 259]
MARGFINDRITDYNSLKSRALGGAPNRQRSDHFDVLNRHLRTGLVTPGQLVIIPDDFSFSCRSEEAWLMRYGEQIRWRLEPSAGSAVINNYDLLQSLLANGSIGIGSATSAWARHLDEVAQTLQAIERLHQRLKGGGLDRGEFARQRQGLFRQLDAQLQGAARFGTGLRGNQSLKKVLGISTKSFLHKGEIAGYAQRVGDVAQVSKWLGKGTYVGLAMDVGVTGLEVKEACMTGREALCSRAKYVEPAKLLGSVAGAARGGALGAKVTRRVCSMVMGIALKGRGELICGVLGGAAGGAVGGSIGGLGGEMVGELIYQPESI